MGGQGQDAGILLLIINTMLLSAIIKAKAALIFKSVDNSTKTLYVAVGEKIEVHCIFTSSREVVNCSGLLWKPDVEQNIVDPSLRNVCVSVLSIKKVSWLGNQTFYCVYEKKENRSLTIVSGYKPSYIPDPRIQWLEHKIQITWIPKNLLSDNITHALVRYTLEYNCTSKDNGICGNKLLPVNYGYFKLDNCSKEKLFHYQVSLFALQGVTYMIRIISQNSFGKKFGRWLKAPISIYPQHMVPEPVENLAVFKTTQFVKLKWDSVTNNFQYQILYACLGNETTSQIFTKNNVYEISHNALPPFKYCTFCVSRQIFPRGNFSCNQCDTVQTRESSPEKSAQLILCKPCLTKYFGDRRNIEISWKIPEKKYWNGIITRQVIFYYATSNRELRNITISNSSKTTHALINLEKNDGYHVYMVICNSAGCSERSSSIYIPPSSITENDEEFQSLILSDRAKTGAVIGISLAILGIFFILIFFVLFIKRHKGVALPDLQEPKVLEQNTNRKESPILENDEEYNMLENKDEADNCL